MPIKIFTSDCKSLSFTGLSIGFCAKPTSVLKSQPIWLGLQHIFPLDTRETAPIQALLPTLYPETWLCNDNIISLFWDFYILVHYWLQNGWESGGKD